MKELKMLVNSLEELIKIIESGECSKEVIKRMDELDREIAQFCTLNEELDIDAIYKYRKEIIQKCANETERIYCKLLAAFYCFDEWEDYYTDDINEQTNKIYKEHYFQWTGKELDE